MPLDEATMKRVVAGAAALTLIALAALLYACTNDNSADVETPEEVAALPPLVANEIHGDLGYLLDDVATNKAVPALFIEKIDVNLDRIRNVDEKKQTFFRIMLPHIARENDRIRAARAEIEKAPDDAPASLFKEYAVEAGDVKELLRRVDVVPASLVLAQAALESGWGRSRFARQGNALFGQWTWTEGAGIVPKDREEGKTHAVKSYRSLLASVRGYMTNLNSAGPYTRLRKAREKATAAGKPVTGRELAAYLDKYSEEGEVYVKKVRSMISVNKLAPMDQLINGR